MSDIGLVLAGGGAKGAYQIGVWKALEEFGITKDIKVVSGTSVGALNATLFTQGDLQAAINLWNNLDKDFISVNKIIKEEDFLLMNPKNPIILTRARILILLYPLISVANRLKKNGIINDDSLVKIINNNISINAIKNSKVKLVITATSFFDIKPPFVHNVLFSFEENTDKDLLTKWLLASSAFPFAYKSIKINETNYIDGGVTNNVPVNVMNDENVKRVIVVHCSQEDDSKIKVLKPSKELFLDIKPSINTGNIINGTMNFGNEKLRKLIHCGYRDTINELYNLTNEKYFTKEEIEKKVNEVNEEILKEFKNEDTIEIRGKFAKILYMGIKVFNSRLKYILLIYITSVVTIPVGAPIETLAFSPALITGFGSLPVLIAFTHLVITVSPRVMKNILKKYNIDAYDKDRKTLVLSRKQ